MARPEDAASKAEPREMYEVSLDEEDASDAAEAGAGPPKKPTMIPLEIEHPPDTEAPPSGDEPKTKRRPAPYVYALASIAALNSANLGYDLGVMSGAARYIREDWNLDDWQLELLIGSLNGCAIGGAAIAHVIIDKFGRRATFAASCFGFIVGVSGMALAPNYWVLLACRVVTGVGVGVGFAIDPVYIAEVAPKEFRGELVTWSEIAINVGILLGFVASFAFRDLPVGLAWRVMLGCGVIAPVVLLICVLTVMPESPRWLVAQGREKEAKPILAKLLATPKPMQKRSRESTKPSTAPTTDPAAVVPPADDDDVDDDPAATAAAEDAVKEIKTAVKRERHLEGDWGQIWRPATPGIRRALFVGVGVAAAQQCMAEESLLFYVTFILEDMNVSRTLVFYALITMGFLKTICIVVSACFLDGRGRRPMLLISVAGMGCALAGIAAAFATRTPILIIACIWGYMMFFSLGIGPVCWLLASEVFPLAIRAKAMALATIANRVVSTVIASTFFTWATAMTPTGYFAFFALVAAVIWGTIWVYLPETKGKSLEEMSAYFEGCVGGRGRRQMVAASGAPRKKATTARTLKKPPEASKAEEATTANPIYFKRAASSASKAGGPDDDDDEQKEEVGPASPGSDALEEEYDDDAPAAVYAPATSDEATAATDDDAAAPVPQLPV